MSTPWPGPIRAITLFVDDLDESRHFYERVFELPIHFQDPVSVVFKFEDMLINLLKTDAAHELVAPERVATRNGGVRFQFTLEVDDVDAMCERLRSLDVKLLNGPVDRPWGVRTASFEDPAGHIWEIAH